jgi:N-acyl-phosphatidylethanolamine-hydrolysing phospholipase D
MDIRLALCVIVTCAVAACTHVNPYYDATKTHHTTTGFKNNHDVLDPPIREDNVYAALDAQLPPTQDAQPFDAVSIGNNRQRRSVTFIGHATVLVQWSGLNILTDPQFSQRASPVEFAGPKRQTAPGASLEQLPHIDVIVISHNHYDHLDLPTIQALIAQPGGQPTIYVPLGNATLLKRLGATAVKELDWWGQDQRSALTITCVPVHHWSARTLWDKNRALWAGWVMESSAGRLFFAGDTAYSPDFKTIGERFGSFDLALLPIGAYAPRSVMKSRHVNPDEAVQIHRDIRSKKTLGIHWGTFALTDEPLGQPLLDLATAKQSVGLSDQDFMVLKHGESYFFPHP